LIKIIYKDLFTGPRVARRYTNDMPQLRQLCHCMTFDLDISQTTIFYFKVMIMHLQRVKRTSACYVIKYVKCMKFMSIVKLFALFACSMDLVVVSGKSVKNTKAFILLPPDCRAAIDILINSRDASCVLASNKYLFARMNANTPLSGTSEMAELSKECPLLDHPERIRSSKLRKYIATVSQVHPV